ncbi:hypothetical protein C1S70_32455 (plasmid) [Azospirillum argentinense]|uniref:Uncharacterized protein n=1 Tax=Azospirillum argentinense TaxID=2970906 RepID=A0A2K1FQN3_9PROT|nr:hypothetical protein C1S70_32455 [Azospirillum argentinense]
MGLLQPHERHRRRHGQRQVRAEPHCPHPGPPPLTQGREIVAKRRQSPPLRSGGGLGWGQYGSRPLKN